MLLTNTIRASCHRKGWSRAPGGAGRSQRDVVTGRRRAVATMAAVVLVFGALTGGAAQSPSPSLLAGPVDCPGLSPAIVPVPPTPDPSIPVDPRDAPEPLPSPPLGAPWQVALVNGDGPEHCNFDALTSWAGGFVAVASVVDEHVDEVSEEVTWPKVILASSDGVTWQLHPDALGEWSPPLSTDSSDRRWAR